MKISLPVAFALLTGASSCSPTVPRAQLDSGPVFGTEVQLPGGAPVNKFLGIPYGEIPERFSKSREPRHWARPLNATKFGPTCFQNFAKNPLAPSPELAKYVLGDDPPASEDCLFINAFAPATPAPKEGRPVLIYIPGGGFQQGHGRADMSGFAAYEDIVAFDLNYRTNVFGFPNTPDIPVKERNLGLLDQRLAIEWVQRNAAAFGGDPAKVTIFGESAGAMSVDVHMNGYGDEKEPPFRAAMMYSGQISFGLIAATADANNAESWNQLSKAVECPPRASDEQLQCMRKANSTLILEHQAEMGLGFGPITDNITLPSHPAERWRKGKGVAKVPLLTGTIAQEGRSLVNNKTSVDSFMKAYFPDSLIKKKQRDSIVEFYQALPEVKNDFDLTTSIYTDWYWQCPQNMLAKASASMDNPTWRFYFNQSITSVFPKGYEWLGKAHGTDIFLLIGSPTYEGDASGIDLSAEQYAFANYFRAMTARFVRNPYGGPGWPAVSSRYAPLDVATLGDMGGAHSAGATPVNQTELDARCSLYEELYPLLEKYVLR